MEQIYVPRYKSTVQIETHFNSYKANLGCALNIPVTTSHIKSLMNYQGMDEEFASLEDSISLQQLAHIDDLNPMPFDPSESSTRRHSVTRVPKKALHLKTVSALIEVQGKYNESHRNRYVSYNKYKHINTSHENDEGEINLNVNDEVVLAVRFYEPFTYRPNANCDLKPKLSQSFLVLGSQTLAELRDRLHCDSKFAPLYDISENPDKPDESEASFDHGFFFIGDTFYNDTRQPTIDYSEVIRNWAKNHENIAELKTNSMEDTKFEELTVRLGYPYLYQHYGNCEHLFTISDIRLISATDSLVRERYPMLKIVSGTKSIICMICGVNEANVVVKDSSAHINDPSHLCTGCFKSYHYVDGKKVGSFKAYRYYGNVMTE
ncbi:snRNA-activating protein complex subunit 3 [Bradysia coprophila]|uniref:snRNA-activating protein complex subunit 3 n=1 Tax=Bradysia coprophila TaxID=38358 RepID=UPI00187DDA96|nr:snRNA-activating protein complex subunit 3 [Bradysia coprophila]